MKIQTSLAILIGFLLISSTGFCQRGRMNGGMNGMNGGMNGSGMNMATPSSSSKPKDKVDPIQASINNLDKQLKLDDFQKAAIAVTMKDNHASMEEIAMSNLGQEEKMDKMQVIRDKIYKGIMEVLNKEQQEKYVKLVEEGEKKALKR